MGSDTSSAAGHTSRLGQVTHRVKPAVEKGRRLAERRVIAAFTSILERQSKRGRIEPHVERAMADALRKVDMVRDGRIADRSPVVREVTDQFHRIFYMDTATWRRNTWQGYTTWKCPLDLWIYQELIHAVRPGLIIETGTAYGGSALFMATLLDVEDNGAIVTVDVEPQATPQHPRVTYLTGFSTDPEIESAIKAMVPGDEPVMVILDSGHSMANVYKELQAYGDLVTVGSYLIVEDTNINGHPVLPEYGSGPGEAVAKFLAERKDFVVDPAMDRLRLTFNPGGLLRRVAVAAGSGSDA